MSLPSGSVSGYAHPIEPSVESVLQLSGDVRQVLGMLLAASLFWGLYFNCKDRLQPEPRLKLVLAFLLGVAAAALAIGAFWILSRLGVPDVYGYHPGWVGVYCFLLIGPIEEGAKALVAVLFVFRWREFDEMIDGLVYSAAIALGFAALENFIHLTGLPLLQQLARSFALPLTHTLFAAVWGYGFAYARLRMVPGWKRTWLQIGSLFAAMMLHGLYDYLIFAHQATYAVGALALILWVGIIWWAQRLLQLKPVRDRGDKPSPKSA